jgi:hypothetical protein
MWGLGLAECALAITGLVVLLSCRFVDDAAVATRRGYLGIGLVLVAAFLTIPATRLIGERAGDAHARRPKGRHRRPKHPPTDD